MDNKSYKKRSAKCEHCTNGNIYAWACSRGWGNYDIAVEEILVRQGILDTAATE